MCRALLGYNIDGKPGKDLKLSATILWRPRRVGKKAPVKLTVTHLDLEKGMPIQATFASQPDGRRRDCKSSKPKSDGAGPAPADPARDVREGRILASNSGPPSVLP